MFSPRPTLAGFVFCFLGLPCAYAQQPAAGVVPQAQVPAGAPQPQQPVQPPQGFDLNQQQQIQLDLTLDAWQKKSGAINTFKCSFQRWEYDVAFGPNQEIPLNKNLGELSYHRPDKGSFQITEINTFQANPVAPGQQAPNPPQGNWVKQPNAVGEHWVCDGKSVFEFQHQQKQLIERPIPPQLQGQGIVDGPLPFLFGAEAAKLKARYWMRLESQPNEQEIWLTAEPRYQAQAADFSKVEVILDRQQLLPKAMQVHMPNGSRHVYMFDLSNASINGPFALLQGLFQRPRTPFGYKRVVEQIPVAQAEQPNEQQTR